MWHTSSQDQLWKVLRGWKGDCSALELGHLTFEDVDLFEVTIDPGLQHLDLASVLVWSGLPAHVRVFERADAVVESGLDHVGKILVIELFLVAGLAALDRVVVQVDLDLSCAAVEVVEVLCFA